MSRRFLALFAAVLFGIGTAQATPPIYGSAPLTTSSLGVPNGAASLDSTGKLPVGQLPSAAVTTSQIGAPNGAASLDSTGRLATGEIPTSVITSSQVGAASGVAELDSTVRLPAGELPTSALTSSLVGAASGVAPLDSTSHVPYANLPVGTTAGSSVYDGGLGAAATAAAAANATAISTETANRIAAFNNLLNISAPFTISPQVPTVSSTDNSNNAASTAFVQAVAASASSGLDPLSPVVAVAAGTNVNVSNPGFTALDGVTLTSGTSRIGLVDETTASQNGIYQYNGSSSALTRTSDANVSADFSNKQVYFKVTGGTVYGGNSYVLQNPGTVTLGTTALNFVLFDSVTNYTAGSGLSLAGSQFAVNFGNTAGTVADGGALAAATATANAALPASHLGAANGAAQLNSSSLLLQAELPSVPYANLPVGTTMGTVYDGGLGAAAAAAAAAAQATASAAATPSYVTSQISTLAPIVSASSQATALLALGTLANVPSTASLEGLTPPGNGAVIIKYGYYSAGDMQPVAYVHSSSPCSQSTPDLGSEIPDATTGCYNVVYSSTIDGRTFGAIAGGTDPNGNNGQLIQNWVEYIKSLHTGGLVDTPAMFWDGEVYLIGTGITDDSINDLIFGGPNVRAENNLGGGAPDSTNPSGGNVCPALWTVTGVGIHKYYVPVMDSNYQPVSGLRNATNGTPQYYFGLSKAWEGSCGGPAPQTGVETKGNNDVMMSNTIGYVAGQFIHGDTDNIPYLDMITGVVTNDHIVLRVPPTDSGSELIYAYNDPSGVEESQNGANAGGTVNTWNSTEYTSSDSSHVGNATLAYGCALHIRAGANDLQIYSGLYENAVASICYDSGAEGAHVEGRVEVTNDAWNTATSTSSSVTGTSMVIGGTVTGPFQQGMYISYPGMSTSVTPPMILFAPTGGLAGNYTLNTSASVPAGTAINASFLVTDPAAIVMSDNSGPLIEIAGELGLGGDNIQAFQASSNPFNIQIGGAQYTFSAQSSAVNSILQLWTDQTGASLANINVNNLGNADNGGFALISETGTGTWSGTSNQFPGPFSINGAITAGSNSAVTAGRVVLTGTTAPANGWNLAATNDPTLYANTTKTFDTTTALATLYESLSVQGAIAAGTDSIISGGDIVVQGTVVPSNGMNLAAANDPTIYANSTKTFDTTTALATLYESLSVQGAIAAGTNSIISGGDFVVQGTVVPSNGWNLASANDPTGYANNTIEIDFNTTSTTIHNALIVNGSVSGAGITSLLSPYLTSATAASSYVPINGAGGTPTSLTLTNATGLPLSTGVTGSLAYANLTALSANQILGAVTATTPSGLTVPSCSASGDALYWTTGTGFGCSTNYATSGANSNITSLTGLTTALSVAQGGTGGTASTGTGNVVLATSPTITTPFFSGAATIQGLIGSHILSSSTAMSVGTGDGFGTGDTVSHTNGSIVAADTVGTSPGSSGTFTMPGANYVWSCGGGYDKTTTTLGVRQIGGTSTSTKIDLQTYLLSTGAATAPTAGDVLIIGPCFGT